MAANLIRFCQFLGRSVPGDIAIMGLGNDLTQCLASAVSISSISIDWHRIGYVAMRAIACAIEHPVKPKLRPTFRVRRNVIVERESTAIYPVDPPWLADALVKMDASVAKPLSVPELAIAAGVSQTGLQQTFNRVFGMSANKYMLSIRMREAMHLLGMSRLSVKEIAARTGFSSASYFCRAYRDYYGHPPRADRR